MNTDIDIKRIRDKAVLLVPKDKEYAFMRDFDNELFLDVIENTEDYIAEGLAYYWLNR